MLIQYPRGYPITTLHGQAHLSRLTHRLFPQFHALHCDMRAKKLSGNQKGTTVYPARVPYIGLKPDSSHLSHYETWDRQGLCRAPHQAIGMKKVEPKVLREQHQLINMVRRTRGGLSSDPSLHLDQSGRCQVQQLIYHSLQLQGPIRYHPYPGLRLCPQSCHLLQTPGPARQDSIY